MRGRWRTGEKLMRKRNLSGGKRFLEDKPVKFVNLSVGKRFLTDKWPTQAGLSVKCPLFTDKAFKSEKNSADVCDCRDASQTLSQQSIFRAASRPMLSRSLRGIARKLCRSICYPRTKSSG